MAGAQKDSQNLNDATTDRRSASTPTESGKMPNPTQSVQSQVPMAKARPLPIAQASVVSQSARAIPTASRPVAVSAMPQGSVLVSRQSADGEDADDEILETVAKKAPPWLVSTLFHTAIIILLGIWVSVKLPKKEIEIDAKILAEQLGQQLEDPSVLTGNKIETELNDEQIITPLDLPPVADPLAAPMEMPTLDLSGPTATSKLNTPVIGLALSGRESGSKLVLLGKYGGNVTTESAVINGLKWLAKQQKSDGRWSLKGPYQDGGTQENACGATAMALLAFQGQGNTHRVGRFKENVADGWKYLLKLQEKDGNFVTTGPSHQRFYAQAQCTIALCELYGMTGDPQYRQPAELAIKYALSVQNKKLGGWRYLPGDDSDTSVTGWFVMALQSARMAKLDVPQSALDRIGKFLDLVQEDGGRTYTYTQGTYSTAAVTAEGLLCRQYLGWKQDDPRLVEGVGALIRNPIDYDAGERDAYYWYYATQACHHMEGKIWDDWNAVMRQAVPEQQIKNGAEAGSWSPDGDKWGAYGGRLYVTCLSIYMLEVYYRHLPIYSGYRFVAEK